MIGNKQDFNIINHKTWSDRNPQFDMRTPSHNTPSQRSNVKSSKRSTNQPARSIRTGDRSQRSQASRQQKLSSQQAPSKRSNVTQSKRTEQSRPERSYHQSTKSSKRSERLQKSQSNKQSEGKASSKHSSKKDSRQPSLPDTGLSGSKVTEWHRPTESKVSQADDLVCDNCLNHDMHDKQKRMEEKQKIKDQEFARQVQENLKKQLEDEAARRARAKQDAIDAENQFRLEQEEHKRRVAQFEKDDMDKYIRDRDAQNEAIEDWNNAMAEGKRELYRKNMQDQMEELEALRAHREAVEREIEKKNHNLLIVDDWQDNPKKDQIEKYMQGLKEQMADEDERRQNAKRLKDEDDAAYKRRIKNLIEEERQRLANLKRMKADVIHDAYNEQQREKQDKEAYEAFVEQEENANLERKVQQENQFYAEFLDMKKQQRVAHAQGLVSQFGKKEREAKAELEADMIYADRKIAQAQKELEDERLRNFEKKDLYRGALYNQMDDVEAQKQYHEHLDREMDRQYVDYNNARNAQIEEWERNHARDKKDKLINELNDQVQLNDELEQRKKALYAEEDAKNHNILLEDYWKIPLQKQMLDEYRGDVIDQINDDYDRKDAQARAELEENLEIQKRMEEGRIEEERFILENKMLKQGILNEDLNIQMQEKDLIREHEDAIKDQELRDLKEQDELHKQQYLANMFAKRKMNQDHLCELVKQLGDQEMQRRIQTAEDKKAKDTTLTIPQKIDKCGTCKNCMNRFPAKRLNKKVRVPKRK